MILQAFRTFIEGVIFLGTSKVTLPKLDFLTETETGDAILGETEVVALGQTKVIKVPIELSHLDEKGFALLNPKGVNLTFRGAKQGEFGVVPYKVCIKGKLTSMELGDFETAKKMGSKIEVITDYLSVDINGINVLELDKRNYVYKVNGIDMLAELKIALAIA